MAFSGPQTKLSVSRHSLRTLGASEVELQEDHLERKSEKVEEFSEAKRLHEVERIILDG